MTPHFQGRDIGIVWASMNLWRQVHGDSVIREANGVDEWNELYAAFNPRQTGTVGFAFGTKHYFFLLNTLGTLYGFCTSGMSQMRAADGSDISAEVARDAEVLLGRVYGWLGKDAAELPAKLAAATEQARNYAEALYEQHGLIATQGGTA